jgi:hypothetical protein
MISRMLCEDEPFDSRLGGNSDDRPGDTSDA